MGPQRRLQQGAVAIYIAVCWSHCLSVLGAELKYPSGVKPGDQISGSEGEFFRYKHVFVKPPDDADRMQSIEMGMDVRCEACEAMLEGLLGKAESYTEDHIQDQLDGEMEGPPASAENAQDARVNANRKGCNKHFKDELLLKGHAIRNCADAGGEGDAAKKDKKHCLEKMPNPPSERDVDTYSVRNEALFYACESTVARYGPELAAALAEKLEDGGKPQDAIRVACLEAAKCAEVRKGKGLKSKKKKKKKKKDDDEEL